MAKTKKPTGLSVARNSRKMTCTWKIADSDYSDGQQFYYRTSNMKKGKWTKVDCGVKTTSKSVNIDTSKFYPNTGTKISNFMFRVRGNRKTYKQKKKKINPGWSDWAEKEFKFNVPYRPSLEVTLNDDASNMCNFKWETSVSAEDARLFVDCEFQSILVENCTSSDGAKQNWKSSQAGWLTGSVSSSSNKNITEDTVAIATGSHTRWFRIRSRGPAGASDWRYGKHVYAKSLQAVIKSATASKLNTGGYNVSVVWEAPSNAAYPIDLTTVQYCFAEPAEGLTCPTDASWEDANVSKDTGGNDKAVFTVDGAPALDQCLFVRVNTLHDFDDAMTYGKGTLASGGIGYLKDPSDLSVDVDTSTYRAEVTATNNSGVADSHLAIIFRQGDDPTKDYVCGIIPHGSTESGTIQLPSWASSTAVSFGVYAFVGSYSVQTRKDGYSEYIVKSKMISKTTLWEGGSVPTAPENVVLTATDISGTVNAAWDWPWDEADSAEISWADHSDAWESTDQPETYTISNLHASKWNISGLETGVTWYFRVRLISSTGENVVYGPYSDIYSIDLSSAPSTPVLVLSDAVITKDGSVTANWAYVTTDGTSQAYAEICEATITSDGITYGDIIAHVESAQYVTIEAAEAGWETGKSYLLAVRVTSASGHTSDSWSVPVPITIAEPLTCEIASTSLEDITVTYDDETTREVKALTAMPLSIQVTGAGAGGTTILAIERAADYHMDRPDETEYDGYEGETIFVKTYSGEDSISIEVDDPDLIGILDDGAPYRIVAVVKDGLGQTDEASLDFEVHWEHQAEEPTASCTIDEDNLIAVITATAPESYIDGDVVDIYRLTADRPELIVEGGSYGVAYVDPYPALGEGCGHRIVNRTGNGDYITSENKPAWIDLDEDDDDVIYLTSCIIDFGKDSVRLPYNLSVTNDWEKDFKETKYLGGSIQGDWNSGVSRSSKITTASIISDDQVTIRGMRRLATYAGICHVRTPDGSSFAADVQVSEGRAWDGSMWNKAEFTLSVTRVDTDVLDGLTLSEWEEGSSEE